MISLHSLVKIVQKGKKRKGSGLGSGKGAKSTRGTTRHQKARTKIPLSFEGGQNKLTKKFPLLRGKTRNRSYNIKPYIINIKDLSKFKKDSVVNLESLVAHNIVDKKNIKNGVKILGGGSIDIALKIELPVSGSAKKKIVAAGGEIISS